jgi:hypothetical protein
MSIYIIPALNAVNFELTSYTAPDLTPAYQVLSAYTIPALNAVDFALTAYTAPTYPYVGWELLPVVPPSSFLAGWVPWASSIIGTGINAS